MCANRNTQAVILAAGRGMRLEGANEGVPKCLLPVDERPLLQHHLDTLRSLGVQRILVIAGHDIDKVTHSLPDHVEVKNNSEFAETNSLFSLWMARNWVTDSLIVINADVLAAPEIYQRVIATPGNALAFDSTSPGESEEMNVRLEKDLLTAISKEITPDKSHGENVGILKFDRSGARQLFASADHLIQNGGERSWAPAALDAALPELKVKGVDVHDLPWTEIDFPEDLTHAREQVWPAITARRYELQRTNARHAS